jgi:F-type H+/Na+-transporting ATPase subunit alpha
MAAEEQAVSVFSGVRGYLDRMLTSEIPKFEVLFLDLIRTKHKHILDGIRKNGDISDKSIEELKAILEEFIPSCGVQMKEKTS